MMLQFNKHGVNCVVYVLDMKSVLDIGSVSWNSCLAWRNKT